MVRCIRQPKGIRMAKLTAGGLLFVLGISLAAQQPPTPTFKSNVNAIVLDVRVVDERGRFVSDLTKDDFRVLEDGREQSIATFDVVNIPLDTHVPDDPQVALASATAVVPPDVATNEAVEPGAPPGRLYVLLLDDVHTDPMRGVDVRAQARAFVEQRMLAGDRAAVPATSGKRGMVQEFTSNRQRLLAAIDQFQGQLHTDIPPPCDGDHTADPAYCATADERATQFTLTQVANWLAPLTGRRKAVLFFGQGAAAATELPGFAPPDSVPGDPNSPGVAVRGLAASMTEAAAIALTTAIIPDRLQTASAAARANVKIYGLGPRGNPSGAFARIVADTSAYYLLGYVPTNDKQDGAFRKLDVLVRRPGLLVQASTGYMAKEGAGVKRASNGISPELSDLMRSPVAAAGLTMRVAAPVFRDGSGKTSVELIVDISGRDLTATSVEGGGKGSLELLAVAADADGHAKASEHGSLAMQLSPATRAAVSEHGLRVLSHIVVPPGRYDLRVAAVDGGGATKGSVNFDLDVPDLNKGKLTFSGLTLAAASEIGRPTTGSDTKWKTRFDEPPTAARTFSPDDELQVAGEIYSRSAASLDVTTTVKRAAGTVVFRHSEPISAEGTRPSTFRHQTTFSLAGFAPGEYTVEVDSAREGSDNTTRRVSFSVR